MTIFLCLPAYNEEPSIDPLFERVARLKDDLAGSPTALEVVLFDDGSTDGTVARAERWCDQLPLTIIRGSENRGLGAALRGLLQHFVSVANETDSMVIMDCDDTHDPMQIPQLMLALKNADVAIASRYRSGSVTRGVPFHRLFVSFIFMLIVKFILPIKGVRDYSCGYRAYRQSLIRQVSVLTSDHFVRESGFAAMPELLWNCASAGARVTEIPMMLGYDRKISESKMDVNANTRRLLLLIMKLRFTRRIKAM